MTLAAITNADVANKACKGFTEEEVQQGVAVKEGQEPAAWPPRCVNKIYRDELAAF